MNLGSNLAAIFSLSLSLCGKSLALPACLASADYASGFGDEVAYLQSYATLHSQSSSLGQTIDVPQSNTASQSSSGQPDARLKAALPLAWTHVPKCGSSLANALIYLPGMCPNLPSGFLFTNLWDNTNYADVVANEWCPGSFSTDGRIQFNDHSGSGGEIYASSVKGHGIIMLRQPEQRILSAYYDNQHSWPVWYYGHWAVDPLEFAKGVSGCAVRMLTREGRSSGHARTGPCGSPEPATAAELTLAKQRLREGFVFVGLTEEWDLSMCLLHAVFGGRCLGSDFLNTNPGSNSSQEKYNVSELMGFTDAPDGALYTEASVVFSEQLQRYGLSYDACRPCFKEASSTS